MNPARKKRANYFQEKNLIWSSKTTAEKNKCLKEMKQKGKSYKQFIAKIQKSHNKKFRKNLRKSKKLNPKQYWTLLKNEERSGKKKS